MFSEKELVRIKELFKIDKQKGLQQALDLSKQISSTDSTSAKGELFFFIADAFYDLENFSSALEWNFQALDIKREVNDRAGEAKVLNNIGITYVELSQYAEALKYFEKAVVIKQDLLDEQSLSATYENIGVVYQRQLNYKMAIESFYQSLKISEKLQDKNRMAITYQNIGSLHYAQGDEISALNMFEQALELRKGTKDVARHVQLINNLAVVLKNLNRTDEAIRYYNECIQISRENNYAAGLRSANNNLGEIYLHLEQYEKAVACYMECVDIAQQTNSVADLKVAELNLGHAELKRGNLEEAENYLLRALKNYEATDHKQGLHDLYLCLSELYESKNDLTKALQFYKTYIQLKSKQLNSDNSTIIQELKTRYEVDKKEKEAEIHRLKNIELKEVLQDITIEKRKSEQLLLNILPEAIASELKQHGKVKTQYYESVSVLFADIKSFSKHSENLSPETVVTLLDFYFELFDNVMSQYQVEKIKTIGDAYLCVCGLPKINAQHAKLMTGAAIKMRNRVREENEIRKSKGLPVFEFRFGIHSGPVIAGIVGKIKFEYDIWGDTVNTAARMEQSGEPGKINISDTTYQLIHKDFTCTHRGRLMAKNKGEMDMYFVD